MACGRTILVWVTILASLTFVLAEEGSSGAENNNEANERMSFSLPSFGMNYNLGGLSGGGLPNFFGGGGGGGNGSSNPFSQFLSAFSQFIPGMNGNGLPSMPSLGGMNGNGLSGMPSLGGMNSSRQTREVHPQNMEEGEEGGQRVHQNRLANAMPISCNYTTQPGARCAGCASREICLQGNRGYLQACTLRQPYCNNGRCSVNPTAACFSTTSSSTANPGSNGGTTV